ncbi:MAG TPA: FUSC family membrane protein [Mucilaginibacter sp.]
MTINYREIKSFFYSQYFSDGIRMTVGILFPALLLMQLKHFDTGVTLSLGALCICTIDSPGPLAYKRNAMAVGNLCLFIVSVITGFARMNVFTLGLEIAVLSFLFSMFTVYGLRAAAVGTCALLIMIFMMDKEAAPNEVLPLSLTILAGGIWYLVFSLIFFGIRPYRAAQQTLGESIADIAKFVRIKAEFYMSDTDIDEDYRKLVSQQIMVSQHQDAVREILFKSRVMVKESTNPSRVLVLMFVDLVDMYEQIMATHYDYSYIREKFGPTGVLDQIADLLLEMADELDNIAYMVLSNTRNRHKPDFTTGLEKLKVRIDDIRQNEQASSNIALKKILINIRDLGERIKSLYGYYNSKSSGADTEKSEDYEYSKFVTKQDYAPHVYFDNFSLNSTAFKHALRVSLVCLVGFVIAKFIAIGHHSYWVLLTIIVILKPGFSLSKQRNYQRLIGTITGGVIGIAILLFIKNVDIQFGLLIILMIGTYSFVRLNYVVSVIFTTPYVLILFKFLGVGMVVQERIIDTAIGSTIALIASYLIFPSWEFEQIKVNLSGVLQANVCYLAKIADSILGKEVTSNEYKLTRKDVYVKSANLSAAFERMTSEPKSKQRKIKEIHKFVVLNHILSSYIATIASSLTSRSLHKAPAENLKLLRRSIAVLSDANKKLEGEAIEVASLKTLAAPASDAAQTPTSDDLLLKEQLGFINKISIDIARITESIVD